MANLFQTKSERAFQFNLLFAVRYEIINGYQQATFVWNNLFEITKNKI